MGGPERAPHAPRRASRPGQAGTLLDSPPLRVGGLERAPLAPRARRAPAKPGRSSIPPGCVLGASNGPPLLPALVAPRPSRDAPRFLSPADRSLAYYDRCGSGGRRNAWYGWRGHSVPARTGARGEAWTTSSSVGGWSSTARAR